MPRAFIPCLTIVAAFQLHVAAASSLYEDVPVSEDVEAAARSIGLDPAADGSRFLSDLIRVTYAPPTGRNGDGEAVLRAVAGSRVSSTSRGTSVRIPLTVDAWSTQILGREVPRADFFRAILTDRRAALLAYGLAGLDDSTLTFVAETPGLLRVLYEGGAAPFAAFSESLRVRDGLVQLPGGEASAPLWTAVVGTPPDRAGPFLQALFTRSSGRLAYLFDAIASLDEEYAAFATGTWMPDESRRVARFAALATAVVQGYGEWSVFEQPFARPLNDVPLLLVRLRVDARGLPLAPNSRTFWAAAFEIGSPAAPSTPSAAAGEEGPTGAAPADVIDAAWLVEATSRLNAYARADRLDLLSFVFRALEAASPAQTEDTLAAARVFRSYRTLALTLERMGVTDPRVYADAARHASRITARNPARAFWALVQFQGALAIIQRAVAVETIGVQQAVPLVTSLTNVPIGDEGRYAGRLAAWIQRELLPLMPRALRAEGRILAGLAGPQRTPAAEVRWEGLSYQLDFAASELDRLRLVREKQSSYTVDLALALADIVRTLERNEADTLEQAADGLETALVEFARELNRPAPDVMARDVRPPADARRLMSAWAADLKAAAARRDASAGGRVLGPLTEVVDSVTGEALLSIAYAMSIGPPDGTALLGRNVAMRHDFGFAHADPNQRNRLAWALPRQEFRPGVAWHVTGAILGLDIALAPLSLRRVSPEIPPEAPRLSSIEREAFAVSVALLDPRRLRDADRDAIAAALALGRQRVRSLAADPQALAQMMDEIGAGPRRRRAILDVAVNDPEAAVSEFALAELLILGGQGAGVDLDAWGMSALVTEGCLCTRMVPLQRRRLLEGRPQMGFVAAGFPDLNLHVAEMLHDLQVPAPLARSVLEAAVLEYVERVAPVHSSDWRTLSRSVQRIPVERIEDYVAMAAAVGGPLVPADRELEAIDRDADSGPLR